MMDNQEKQPFLTDAFYAWDYETISVFNELIAKNLEDENDHYESGTFLFFSVRDCPESREILSRVISDIEQYQEAIKGMYADSDEGSICLLGLQEMHAKYFGNNYEIMWHEETNSFMTHDSFFAEDDEYDVED